MSNNCTKWLFFLPLVILISCRQQASKPPVKVAAAREIQTKPQVDSSLLLEQDQHSLWLTKTWYALKYGGYSNKRAWLYIDSVTRYMYKGVVPQWYEKLKQQSDSLFREKNKYKRVRIV